jgi:hypothetical protein
MGHFSVEIYAPPRSTLSANQQFLVIFIVKLAVGLIAFAYKPWLGIPDAEYAVTKWRPKKDERYRAVLDFVRAGRTGVAWPSTVEGGRELFAPWSWLWCEHRSRSCASRSQRIGRAPSSW